MHSFFSTVTAFSQSNLRDGNDYFVMQQKETNKVSIKYSCLLEQKAEKKQE